MNVLDVFHLHDLSKSIGTCTIQREDNEIIGYMSLEAGVDDNLYVYYRYNSPEDVFYAIQLLPELKKDTEAFTIRELLR